MTMPNNPPHNALAAAMAKAEAEGRVIDWDVIAPPRPAFPTLALSFNLPGADDAPMMAEA